MKGLKIRALANVHNGTRATDSPCISAEFLSILTSPWSIQHHNWFLGAILDIHIRTGINIKEGYPHRRRVMCIYIYIYKSIYRQEGGKGTGGVKGGHCPHWWNYLLSNMKPDPTPSLPPSGARIYRPVCDVTWGEEAHAVLSLLSTPHSNSRNLSK